MGQYSKVEIDGRLMIVTINRPEVYNACHPMANQELVDAFDEFQTNPELWVAIITGAGDKAFCAGNDLKYHAEIQANIDRHDLPDHTWAEELFRLPEGAWTQAFQIVQGKVYPVTDITFVAFAAQLYGDESHA